MYSKLSKQIYFPSSAICHCCCYCCCCFFRQSSIIVWTKSSPLTCLFLQHSHVIVLSRAENVDSGSTNLQDSISIRACSFVWFMWMVRWSMVPVAPYQRLGASAGVDVAPDPVPGRPASRASLFPEVFALWQISPTVVPIRGRPDHIVSRLI